MRSRLQPRPGGRGADAAPHAAAAQLRPLFELLGKPEDDTENTFTARMLLVLESRPILGDAAYRDIVEKVIDRYWCDTEYHRTDYQPILLVNDIVRYWRTILLNYEAGIHRRRENLSSAEWEVDRKLRSYKVGFSRCLTCYSALAYLLAVTRTAPQPHVNRTDVRNLIALSPLERLLWVGQRAASVEGIRPLVDKMVGGYLDFLEMADRGEEQLFRDFSKPHLASQRARAKRAFGDAMFELVSRLGEGNPLMRWLVV